MAWWDTLPIRSGRASASGTAFWYDRPGDPISATARLTSEELDVALIDAMCGSSVGTSRSNVSTWARLIGDPVGAPIATGALNSIDTQFDWRTPTLFAFGHCIAWLPTGGIYATDGSGWLVWTSQSIPAAEATSLGSSPIWAAIIAGTHDAKYVKFGERVVTKMASTGHPLKRLIIDFNHEMNQSNDFQIWAGNRTEYKAAMERTITKIREGADNITPGAGAILKFMHRPAYRVDQGQTKIGAYNSFIPNNVDVLALSIHPDASCNSAAACDQLFAGTLNAEWYGTDELIAAAIALNLPIAFPEWSPQFQTLSANGGACPAANTLIQKFYENVIQPNRARLVCDCIWHQNVRDTTGYTDTDPTGVAQWEAMVATRKSLWVGTQSDSTVPTNDSFTYTVTDDWGSRTASVAVTIQGGAVLFVNATDDNASGQQGTPVLVSPLGNDNASPSLLPLVVAPGSVTAPSPSGAALITGGSGTDILYTPTSGFVGEATFAYDAQSSVDPLKRSTALVRVQMTAGPTLTEFPSSAGFTVRPRASGATSVAEFNAAYTASQPGDHVVVAAGVDLGAVSLSRSGSTANPIVIRAATNQTAEMSGTLTITGSNLYLWGFRGRRFRNNISNTASPNNRITLRRMAFNDQNDMPTGTAPQYISGEMRTLDFRAEYCTFYNASGGLRFNNPCRRGTLKFCHWFHITNPAGDTPAECLIVLEGIDQTFTVADFLVEDCLFEDCNVTGGAGMTENETFSIKSSGNIFRRVQFENCRDFNMRFGNDNQILGCVVRRTGGSSEISARGMRHVFNNCDGIISLDSGNYNSSQNPPIGNPSGADFPNAQNCTIIGGPAGDQIKLGPDSNHTVQVTGTRIEGRGPNPTVSVGQSTNPTIVANTSIPLATPANFPLGGGITNNVVGVHGGL